MRSSHAIAIWLFERLDLDPALTGDLLEECERGRSIIWYWRQVLIAIWIGIWGAIRDHKALALRAVATGSALDFLLIVLWERWGPDFPMFSTMQWITQLSVTLLAQALTGWVVARTHRTHQIPMVLMYLICFLLWYVQRTFSFACRVVVDWIDQPSARPYLAMYLLTIFMMIVGAMLGGILARPKKSLCSQKDAKTG